MGCAASFFLKSKDPSISVKVIEKDPSYSRASTGLSAGSIRNQFSIKGNIEMSMFGASFLKNIKSHLSTEDENDIVDVQFVERGYLFLATDKGLNILKENFNLQKSLGADVEMMHSADDVKSKFSFINTDGIRAAVYGNSGEGWFDPWSLLTAFRKKSMSLGVEFIKGTCEDVILDSSNEQSSVTSVLYRPNKSDSQSNELETVQCGTLINAAGPWASHVSKLV